MEQNLQMWVGGMVLQQLQMQSQLEAMQKRVVELEAKLRAAEPAGPNPSLNGGSGAEQPAPPPG